MKPKKPSHTKMCVFSFFLRILNKYKEKAREGGGEKRNRQIVARDEIFQENHFEKQISSKKIVIVKAKER